jgi:hypothetical protein
MWQDGIVLFLFTVYIYAPKPSIYNLLKLPNMKMLRYVVMVFSIAISYTSIAQSKGCGALMPHSNISFDTAKPRGLADNYYLWDNGKTIVVRFLSGGTAMQDRIKTIAKEWEKYANIYFTFVPSGASHIRVNLDSKGGHNSLIGILATMIDPEVKTMNLDTTDFKTYEAMRRTVLHEFGHALGLLHEHYSPVAGIPWNKEVVYKELGTSQGWDKQTVDVNLFQEFKVSYTNGTQYDKKSIMHYPILAKWTTSGYSVPWNNEISEGDKALIAALYPKTGERVREVPRFVVTDYTKMDVLNSSTAQGLLLYPSFNISTAGKEGKVYFTVLFYDKDGNAIKDNNDKYNISNIVATFKSFSILPGKKLAANKNNPRDFELFIPYTELPLPSGTNSAQAVFRAFLVDGDEIKSLYSSTPVSFSVIR